MNRTIRPGPEPEELLVRLACAGDVAAFQQIYELRQGSIYRFVLHMTGNRAAAEDVTQEVFMSLIQRDCAFDPTKGTLSAYLYGVARNQLFRYREKEERYVALPEEESVAPKVNGNRRMTVIVPAVDLERSEKIDRVRRAVLSLPAAYREPVVLCDLQEMSYEETARILGCAVGTVRSRLHRGRTLLMQKLKDSGASRSQTEQVAPEQRASRP